MIISFPTLLSLNERVAGNPIRQLSQRASSVEGECTPFTSGQLRGFLLQSNGSGEIVVLPKAKRVPERHVRVIEAASVPTNGDFDLSDGIWVRHPLQNSGAAFVHQREIEDVLKSWMGAFAYIQEDLAHGILGLRAPQIGAVHAVHAHWAVSNSAATIVMPTGTGKTDTMISILASALCPKLLVIVPTDALRTQIADKFLTLGILKEPGCAVLSSEARFPIVGMLQHIPQTIAEVDEIFSRCQVIVTSSSIAGQCEPVVQDRMAFHCPYLFIDEAHHAEAPTWSGFKERFKGRRILQFTATPFREDGKPLDGDIIFKYPLKKAQEEGYFKPIKFRPVTEFNRKKIDIAIATQAVEALRRDLDKGHILMARVDSVNRAKQVFDLYSKYPEFNPVQLHTGVKSQKARDAIRRKIISGESRIVVCVDMLGEGFDLPELKIAAFHDIRKTLAVTLQLAGRFTRSRPDLGDAVFIANTADVNVQEELRKLYTRDPDWNVLLPELSDSMIGEQLSLQEFLRGFTDFTTEIPLKTVRPATSTVVYRTRCQDWNPANVELGIPAREGCEQVHHTINHARHTLVIVTARRVPLSWTDVETLFSWDWELYVVIWSPEKNLLFINGSTNAGDYKALAQAIAGDDVEIINGQDVFRTFAGVNRLRLQNVGLTEQLGRNVRYTGRMGSDVEPALTPAQRQRARKSVLSGTGYEDGEVATVGASRKGRIWSHQRTRVDQLAEWCEKIGAKLLDASIDPDDVLKGTLEAKTILERPRTMPIAVDWPEEVYTTAEAMWSVSIDNVEIPLSELEIELVTPSVDRALRIAIASEGDRAELELEFYEKDEGESKLPNYRFSVLGDKRVKISRGDSEGTNIETFFYYDPPIIWFADGSSLEGNQHVPLKNTSPPYDATRIQVLDWNGVNIRKESQGRTKDQTSIQARVIRELTNRDYSVIFDDDDSGEAADIVAIRLVGEPSAPTNINVEFYHCKYSSDDTPGQRVKDLYEVCGQAQKSISWISSPQKKTDIFTHLLRREAKRQDDGGPTRFQVGDWELLQTIREMSHLCAVRLSIHIVQPGVSKSQATREQLLLLAVTESYLMETRQVPFAVIASP
jgi:superfamily II DNA or RNA helicase